MESVTSTAINVSWLPPAPESSNGIIRHYTCWIRAWQPWMNISQVLDVNSTALTLTGLIPHTAYYIQVRAVTILPGPYSASMPIATLEAGICVQLSLSSILAIQLLFFFSSSITTSR